MKGTYVLTKTKRTYNEVIHKSEDKGMLEGMKAKLEIANCGEYKIIRI